MILQLFINSGLNSSLVRFGISILEKAGGNNRFGHSLYSLFFKWTKLRLFFDAEINFQVQAAAHEN